MLTDEQYTLRVLVRASNEWHGDKVNRDDFIEALKEFIEAGNRLDRIKKALFYGRDFSWEENGRVYPVDQGIRSGSWHGNIMTHAILGLATEGVELCEALLKGLNDPESFDRINLQEEFGDANWYRTLGLYVLGQTHVENITQNDAKLEKRFGAVFSVQAANERDLDAERSALEGKQIHHKDGDPNNNDPDNLELR